MSLEPVRVLVTRLANISFVLLASFALAAPVAYAQEDEDVADNTTAAKDAPPVEEVVVTGSRLKRDTYSSISPLQVISGQVSREVGLIDPSTILQESTAATGIQIDLTFSGFRLDNGPAASTIDLRGLGDSRTLVLVNGRRLAPAGVEGAPYAVDTNLIPGSLVQQYEVLLDGASSVYGSDAVAGVVNVILRKDFDGFELEGFSSVPAAGNSEGMQNQLNATWGYNGDRGFIGVGVEYRDIQSLTLADRDWTSGCEKHREITTDGEIRTEDLFYSTVYNQKSPGDCSIGSFAGFMNEFGPPRIGSLFSTPGTTNIGIPGWSHWNSFGVPIDTTNSGIADVSFADYNFNGNDRYAQLIPNLQTTAALAFGEYTFAGESNLTPYFELQYNRRESDYLGGPGNVGAFVPALNPFNPCNPNQPNGVDCGTGWDSLMTNPDFVADFFDVYGAEPADFGLLTGAVGAFDVLPVFTARGDRDGTVTDLEQTRAVVGIRGDMPFIDAGSLTNWSFDAYMSFTESDGTSSRLGIREDRMDLALGNYSTNAIPCENDVGADLAADAAPGCVPFNPFAPSLYAGPVQNDFATQAERDYLFDSRDFRTKYKQTIYSVYANGELFDLPGGTALFGLGAEYREDDINSIPDQVAADGLLVQFFVDQGAVGKKTTKEFFAELELPLLANVPAVEELTANFSTRHTKDEFYGGAWTYSAKLAYRPVDSLLLRATTGTSFRAPNLRENFLLGQTGFLRLGDPCVVPFAAVDPVDGYDPALDNRSPEVIANCVADPNVDPFTFTNGGNAAYDMEVNAGGATDIKEETSESTSLGLTWDLPFFTAFDLVFGLTYYDIQIRDEIIEPSASFIIADCYTDPEGNSPFCSRVARDPVTSEITIIDQGFINRDQLNARGVDLNMRMNWPTQVFGRAVDFSADFAFNRTLELSSKLLEGDAENLEEFQGEIGYPEWQGQVLLRADVGDFRYTWGTRYLSSVNQDRDARDDFSDIFGIADTCLGAANGDVDCRDVGFADNYFVHSVSMYYLGDTWTVGGGLRNVFNAAPPFFDPTESPTRTNASYGSGYDLFGRTAFVNVVYKWD